MAHKRRWTPTLSTVTITCSLVVMVILSIFTLALNTTLVQKDILENTKETTSKLNSQLSDRIDDYFLHLRSIQNFFGWDIDILNYLNKKDVSQNNIDNIQKHFENIKFTREDITNIGLLPFNDLEGITDGLHTLNKNVNYRKLDWFQKAVISGSKVVISTPHVENIFDGDYSWVITVSKLVVDSNTGKPLGLIVIDLNYQQISSISMNNSFGLRGYTYIVDRNGEMIYHPQQQLIYSGLKRELLFPEDKFTIVGLGENKKLYCTTRGRQSNWSIVNVVYLNDLNNEQLESQRYIYVATIMALLTVSILLVIVIKIMTNPLKRIEKRMKGVSTGFIDFSPIEVKGIKEVDSLAYGYNVMVSSISSLMDKSLKDAELKRKLELAVLQGQINPHFLYNTLDSIIWMAALGDKEAVVTMTKALSSILHQNIGNTKEHNTFSEEVEYLDSYLSIQKLRYEDKLDYEIIVSEDILDCKIVKLILQPLVENSIYHGIKPKEGKGFISICATEFEDYIEIVVDDNGVGMDVEKDKEASNIDDKNCGIGLNNVRSRLKLYYGYDYGLTFKSYIGKGTRATVKIPKEY